MTTRRPDPPPSMTTHDDDAPPASGLSSMQRAIMTIQKMRAKIESLERARVEPIAIIGMGCRFPGGASTPEAFFRLLEEGVDTIREVPPDRWSLDHEGADAEGEARALRWGSFLDDVDRFDAAFFGISPREAESLDPQQRLLLEVAWEALERAGQLPERLMGSRTGVFVGVWALDYQQRVLALREDQLDAYCFTGNVLSTAAGRLSYTLGLQGPCMSVETACSSSLTAIHLACQSLRNGESNLAVAGGVNLMLSPLTTKLLLRTQALSPDGRCKTFDSRANGFVRGEGCGIVLLKRLSDAERDGDSIIAIIRGSAVNQDGRSTGLTAPNVLSQQALLRQALENARVAPSDVGYVEAHGTGTSLGDPIEVEALKAVLGGPREKGSVCVLGALKTNIGHLEAAAGVAGLMKVAMSLHNERIPPNLHFRSLNPRIDLRGTSLEIAQNIVPWKPGLRPRIGGVSAFGISGTNAHVVLEEAPRNLEEQLGKEASAYLLPLSAKTPEALLDLARGYERVLAGADGPRLLDVAHTASARRTHFEHRLSAVGGTKEELVGKLGAFLRGEAPAGVVQGKATPARAKVVFVFSGQGSQWLGMGRKLYEEESAFRSVIDSCDALLTGRLGWSILDELDSTEAMSRLAETQVAQPMLFAIQIALVELLRSWGIAPDAVIGHSVGEIAAAHIAGILSLDEAVRLVAIRGRIMQKATGAGKMVAVAASPEVARRFLAGYETRVSIAAVNDPGSVVLAGQTQAVDEVVTRLERDGFSCRPLRVNYAFHSPQMEPLAAELMERLVRVDARRATLAMYSTVLAECVEGKELDVRYWGRNVRETVNLAGAVGAAIHDGYQLFLEVGPHPVLASNLEQCLAAKMCGGFVAHSMRKSQGERRTLLEATGALYTRGCAIEWTRLLPHGGKCIPLPTYPWRRERHWLAAGALPLFGRGGGVSAQAVVHPLLGVSFESSLHSYTHFWERPIGKSAPPWVAEHVVQGEVVFPGAGYTEMALAAAALVLGEGPVTVEDLSFEAMMVLPEQGERFVQVALVTDALPATVRVSSRATTSEPWLVHARARVRRAEEGASLAPAEGPAEVRARCNAELTAGEHYAGLEARGLSYGKLFRGVHRVWIGRNEAIGKVLFSGEVNAGYRLHPALLDACFQVAGSLVATTAPEGAIVPVHIERMTLRGAVGIEIWAHARLSSAAAQGDDEAVVELVLSDPSGAVVAEIHGLRFRRLQATKGADQDLLDGCAYELRWQEMALASSSPVPQRTAGEGFWLVLSDAAGKGAALGARLRARGVPCVLALASDHFERVEPDRFKIDPARPGDIERLVNEAFTRYKVCQGIVHLTALDAAPWESMSADALGRDEQRVVASAIHVTRLLLGRGARDVPRLVLVTRGARSVGEDIERVSVSQAPLWGLARTVALEHPDLECTCVDLAASPFEGEMDRLADEITSPDGEDQIAIRDGRRHVARLARVQSEAAADVAGPALLVPAAGRSFRIDTTRPGMLDGLSLLEMERRAPGLGEVEIEVEATGLNFLDVLLAMGVLPDDVDGAVERTRRLGVECAGRIVAVGAGVEDLRVGQEVVALGLGAMATHLVTSRLLVTPKPARLGWEEAASLPVVFLTAYHALCHVARLRKGERVLIHAGAGGVGMAAIQWARHVGAEIFATAGSEEKRALLRSLGVQHVMDSRSLSFVEDVRRITNGEGVDVVLNSLSGEFIPASLGLLRDYGRFVEIGKRDYYEDRAIGLKPFLKNLSYSLVDLRGMMLKRPEIVASLLSEVMALFESGALAPLPCRTYPASRVAEGFVFMAQARHTGKITISMRDEAARVLRRRDTNGPLVRPEATYLITGGLGGLGLSVARWMVEQGARHVVLVGRSGPSEDARQRIREMEVAGAEVLVARADVSRIDEVRSLVARLKENLPPLRGVVHAAAVLDDHTLLELDAERVARVFAPKARGAWNLHEATRDIDLDFFVMYSSVASLVGSPGQGNYAAANAFLDALGQSRRASGLPATSIQWGPFSQVGMAATLEKRGGRLARRGLESFSPEEGVRLFARLLRAPWSVVAVVRMSVRQWLESYPQAAASPFWSELRKESVATATTSSGGFRAAFASAAAEQRLGLVEQHVLELLGRVIRADGSRIDRGASFTNLGLDSLMSIELRNRLEASLGLKLPATLLFTYANAARLAEHLLSQLQPPAPAPAPPPVAAPPAAAAPPPPAVEAIPDTARTGVALPESDDDLIAAFDASVRDLKS